MGTKPRSTETASRIAVAVLVLWALLPTTAWGQSKAIEKTILMEIGEVDHMIPDRHTGNLPAFRRCDRRISRLEDAERKVLYREVGTYWNIDPCFEGR